MKDWSEIALEAFEHYNAKKLERTVSTAAHVNVLQLLQFYALMSIAQEISRVR